MTKAQSKGFGRKAVYVIALVPLLVILGDYFLEYVPAREEYFLNLRFRTLGVIGRQIESKLEAVSSGLTYARDGIDQATPDGTSQPTPLGLYVGRVFPGLVPPAQSAPDAKPSPLAVYPDIEFPQYADRVRFIVGPSQVWEDSLAHLIRPLTDDENFDDVLLVAQTEKKAAVLFQRSGSPPRLRDLSELLKKSEVRPAGALQFFHPRRSDGGPDSDLLKDVGLDGSGYRLLIQPLTIRVPRSPKDNVKDLMLCGLVHSNTLRREAFHVPPKYLLYIIIPILAAFLSGPLIKLILIRRTGRFELRDVRKRPRITSTICRGGRTMTFPVGQVCENKLQEDQEREVGMGGIKSPGCGRVQSRLASSLCGVSQRRHLLLQGRPSRTI